MLPKQRAFKIELIDYTVAQASPLAEQIYGEITQQLNDTHHDLLINLYRSKEQRSNYWSTVTLASSLLKFRQSREPIVLSIERAPTPESRVQHTQQTLVTAESSFSRGLQHISQSLYIGDRYSGPSLSLLSTLSFDDQPLTNSTFGSPRSGYTQPTVISPNKSPHLKKPSLSSTTPESHSRLTQHERGAYSNIFGVSTQYSTSTPGSMNWSSGLSQDSRTPFLPLRGQNPHSTQKQDMPDPSLTGFPSSSAPGRQSENTEPAGYASSPSETPIHQLISPTKKAEAKGNTIDKGEDDAERRNVREATSTKTAQYLNNLVSHSQFARHDTQSSCREEHEFNLANSIATHDLAVSRAEARRREKRPAQRLDSLYKDEEDVQTTRNRIMEAFLSRARRITENHQDYLKTICNNEAFTERQKVEATRHQEQVYAIGLQELKKETGYNVRERLPNTNTNY
ncbi:hypothetical protein K469DRAFT_183050 [Zopfia rhizophila CBS 207.26]|uniref:Uncharacterized protein n=1 Tax=Zopfia rhizophila CBS 207.26 TaxID=1314779 RepID=A0A6A6E3C4_9PEZI|nr:hypothetical protein K469DRAFT_183050 [Zopfia rhizophila CBS 207.26]